MSEYTIEKAKERITVNTDKLDSLLSDKTICESNIEEKESDISSFDLADYFDDDDFESFLNDLYPNVVICGIEFSSGTALREVDPTAFSVQYSDLMASMDSRDYNSYTNAYKELEDELEYLQSELDDIEEAISEIEAEISEDENLIAELEEVDREEMNEDFEVGGEE